MTLPRTVQSSHQRSTPTRLDRYEAGTHEPVAVSGGHRGSPGKQGWSRQGA